MIVFCPWAPAGSAWSEMRIVLQVEDLFFVMEMFFVYTLTQI